MRGGTLGELRCDALLAILTTSPLKLKGVMWGLVEKLWWIYVVDFYCFSFPGLVCQY